MNDQDKGARIEHPLNQSINSASGNRGDGA
jgi:hypothetical protein